MRDRRLPLVVNLPGLLGLAYRVVMGAASCEEPMAALASALRSVGWSLRQNPACLRSQS